MNENDVKTELFDLASALGINIQNILNTPDDDSDNENLITNQKWKGKWDYISNPSNPEFYRIPAQGGLISKHHPISQGGFATSTHSEGHFGLDIGNNKGTPVYSIGPGQVISITNESNNPKGGNSISISHENGSVKSYYAHLDQITVSVGDQVDQNTQIGTIGTSGAIYNGVKRVTDPHLHFQVKVNGTDIDPTQISKLEIGSLSKNASNNKLQKVAQRIKRRRLNHFFK
jgi:murein DD-endopeptidase MepM/ murein hydrolase activator NlpD